MKNSVSLISRNTPKTFTKHPHEISEALMRAGVPDSHRRVFEKIERETLGFHRERVALRVADFEDATGLHARSIRRAIGDLEQWGVISREGAGRGRVAVFVLHAASGWRIGRTADTIRANNRRQAEGHGAQMLLPLSGFGSVVAFPVALKTGYVRKLPTPEAVTSRDTDSAISRDVSAAPYKGIRKKGEEYVPREPPQRAEPKTKKMNRSSAQNRTKARVNWDDSAAAAAFCERRLVEALGFEPFDDLQMRCAKALSFARGRDTLPREDPNEYCLRWLLNDAERAGKKPIPLERRADFRRTSRGDDVAKAFDTEDLFGPQLIPEVNPFDPPTRKVREPFEDRARGANPSSRPMGPEDPDAAGARRSRAARLRVVRETSAPRWLAFDDPRVLELAPKLTESEIENEFALFAERIG